MARRIVARRIVDRPRGQAENQRLHRPGASAHMSLPRDPSQIRKALRVPFSRYAIFFTPAPGALASFGASWLGWDLASGRPVPHPSVAGLPQEIRALTAAPRRYGFHATLKPPFVLAPGQSEALLQDACAELASGLPVVPIDDLAVTPLGRFLALTANGEQTALRDLAARVVRELDSFRAPATASELARRRQARLTGPQEALLLRWGYPFVMQAFRFHLTLTGRLPRAEIPAVQAALCGAMAPCLSAPATLDALTLAGEDGDGHFHAIARFALGG